MEQVFSTKNQNSTVISLSYGAEQFYFQQKSEFNHSLLIVPCGATVFTKNSNPTILTPHRVEGDDGDDRHDEHAAGALERSLVVRVGVAAPGHILVLAEPYSHLTAAGSSAGEHRAGY